jgi:hypothetical protein
MACCRSGRASAEREALEVSNRLFLDSRSFLSKG